MIASLDGDLAEEDAKFAAYLALNGWSGTVGAEDAAHLVASSAEKGQGSSTKLDDEVEG